MSKPPVRFREIIEALRIASPVIIIGWTGIIALAYMFTIPLRDSLPRAQSALLTAFSVILLIAWLISWRALARSIIMRGSQTRG